LYLVAVGHDGALAQRQFLGGSALDCTCIIFWPPASRIVPADVARDLKGAVMMVPL
jgi:hypothetical protein